MNKQIHWLRKCLLPYKLDKTLVYYRQSAERTAFKNNQGKRKTPQLNAWEKLDAIENFIIQNQIAEEKINGKSMPEMITAERHDKINIVNPIIKIIFR